MLLMFGPGVCEEQEMFEWLVAEVIIHSLNAGAQHFDLTRGLK